MKAKSSVFALGKANRAFYLPLTALVLSWITFMAAWYVDLFFDSSRNYDSFGNYVAADEQIVFSRYLFLLGILIAAAGALAGKILAQNAGESRLAKASSAFGTVSVISALIAAAFFAIATFMTSLDGGVTHSVPLRLMNVYLPILIDAVVVVLVILKAFVTKKGEHDED
jgi:cytochrome bd-type quinol oxidase subunit 2